MQNIKFENLEFETYDNKQIKTMTINQIQLELISGTVKINSEHNQVVIEDTEILHFLSSMYESLCRACLAHVSSSFHVSDYYSEIHIRPSKNILQITHQLHNMGSILGFLEVDRWAFIQSFVESFKKILTTCEGKFPELLSNEAYNFQYSWLTKSD